MPKPVLLPRRIDRDRADHHQRPGASVVARKRHRPSLDRPEERAILDEREAQRRDRRRAVAHLIGGSRVPIGAERTVEQLLHGGVVDLGQRREPWGRELRDRKSVVWGKSVSVRVDLGGRRLIKKKNTKQSNTKNH